MTDVELSEVVALLDEVRRELTDAVEELERSRSAHREVESLLLAVLEHVPVPLVVIDAELRVRAASGAAERAWSASLDRPASAIQELDSAGIPDACRTAIEAGHVPAGTAPEGFELAVLDEPGAGPRYVTVWTAP